MRWVVFAGLIIMGLIVAAHAQVNPNQPNFGPPTATAPVTVQSLPAAVTPLGLSDLLILTHQKSLVPALYQTQKLTVAQLAATMLGTGTAGQVGVYINPGSILGGQGPFTAGAPVLGNGILGLQSGGKIGSSNTFAAATGTFINGDCRSTDSNLNEIDAGGPCTIGGGGGTVAAALLNQLGIYPSNGTTIAGTNAPAGAYTWTGLNSYTTTAGGIHEAGSANITSGYQEPPSPFGHVIDITAISTTTPETSLIVNMSSSVTGADPVATFKRAVSVTAECNPGSADCWGQTGAVELFSGGTKRGGIIFEADLNNFFGSYSGSPSTPYAANFLASGQNNGGISSCAFCAEFAEDAGPMWQAAYHIGPPGFLIVGTASFWDESNSPNVILATGATHTNGINFGTTTFTGNALITPGAHIDGSGNVVGATLAAVNGANCSGVPTASFHVVSGIITHC